MKLLEMVFVNSWE